MARPLGGLEDQVDRSFAGVEVRREPALVADERREPALGQHLLQRVIDLGADAEPLGERVGAGRDDHELLEVDRVRRVRAAVDHVQHRHRQRRGVGPAEVRPQRRVAGCGLGGGEGDAENRVRAEAALVRGPVELDQRLVECFLVARVEPLHGSGELAVHVSDCLTDALAAPLGGAVAELDRLVHAGRRTRRDDRTAERARFEPNIHFDGRVATRVEHLASVHCGDPGCHEFVPFASS